jgi:arginine/lysine/ornithine decarboxylase
MADKRNTPDKLPPVQRQSIAEATAEAESRALEYDPSVRAQYVRSMLQDIARWMAAGDSEETIKQRIPEFIENYPELYKKISNRQDLAPIQSMLSLLDRMGEGNLSQHQASVIVGKKLVDRYVTPQLNGGAGRK